MELLKLRRFFCGSVYLFEKLKKNVARSIHDAKLEQYQL